MSKNTFFTPGANWPTLSTLLALQKTQTTFEVDQKMSHSLFPICLQLVNAKGQKHDLDAASSLLYFFPSQNVSETVHWIELSSEVTAKGDEASFKSFAKHVEGQILSSTSEAFNIAAFSAIHLCVQKNPKWLSLLKSDVASVAQWYTEWLASEDVKKALVQFKKYGKSTVTKTSKEPLPTPKVKPVAALLNHKTQQVLPKPNERNILITSALPYVNNVPHLGNIIGCVLSGDVYARFCRLRGYNTLYICGTDEYGTATETKALEEGISCQAICDKYHAIHKQCYEWFGIDFDHFGRTTTQSQTKIAQDIFKRCDANQYLIEETITQLYCEKHQSFLADRFVEGTCPNCGYDDARGDQCDKCQKLLNATDLKNPHCKLDGATPVIRDSKHLFLNLKELQSQCESWVQKSSIAGKWTDNGINITNSWLKEGLKPRCITRDLKWGTPVPKAGYENKVFYVWFDAPIGYPSITAGYTKDWEKWWKNPKDVELYQFMGKDNVPFHTVIFPCSLMATKEDWTLVHHINTTEYLQYEGTKFSKSRGIGVFGNNVMDSGIPVAVWRYYLFANRPETNDSQFTWKSFIAANNGELLANLGNFVNRLVKFMAAKYDSVVPSYSKDQMEEKDVAFIADIQQLLKQYVLAMEAVKIRLGLKLMMDISARGNLYLQENKLDNALFADQKERCDLVVSLALNVVYLLASVVHPFMPTTSDAILRQLNLPLRTMKDIEQGWTGNDILPGHTIGHAEYLFQKLDEKLEDQLRQKYGGQQSAPASPEKKKKPNRKAEAPSAAQTPEMKALEDKISVQGNKVRELKAQKADAALIKQEVDVLLNLKKELSDMK